MASGVTTQKNQLWGSKKSQAWEEAGGECWRSSPGDSEARRGRMDEVDSSTSKVHQVAPHPFTWLSAAAWGSRWRSTWTSAASFDQLERYVTCSSEPCMAGD